MGVRIGGHEVGGSLMGGPGHVPVFRRQQVANRHHGRVAVRDLLAVVVSACAAGDRPRVVHAGRDLVLVVVLERQLQAFVGRRVVGR